jgi:FO synthase
VWVDEGLRPRILDLTDAEGFPRVDPWSAGERGSPPLDVAANIGRRPARVPNDLAAILGRAQTGEDLSESDVVRLFAARGGEVDAVTHAADALRREINGDTVTFVVNRNINYTNVCYFKCQFCAFSKGKLSENLRGRPYDLPLEEIQRRTVEAWERGGTEVCMQGGIHPDYTGQTYLDIVAAVREAVPEMHIHAFSPLEVWQGAATLGLPLDEYLRGLKAAGLGTLPGTAAEILDDEVRRVICADKITTAQWLEVNRAAAGSRPRCAHRTGGVAHPGRGWRRSGPALLRA